MGEVKGQATLTSFTCASTYDWDIEDFCSLPNEPISKEFVVPFPYKIFRWKLTLHPNGFDKKFKGYLSLFLNKLEPLDSVKVTYSLGILDKDKRLANKREFTHITFLEDGIGPGCAELVSRSWLEQYSDLYLPNKTLTIRCIMDLSEAFANRESLERVEGEAIASHGALNDFGKMLELQQFTDFTIKVGEQSIGVHRAVLAARSVVLDAMLKHDDQESRTRIMEINDFEFEVIQEMLRFLYNGRSNAVAESESLAWDLLRSAEKYQLPELKTVCEKELMLRLTPKNAVETVTLASFLHATWLVEAAVSYIAKKARDVRTYSNIDEDLAKYPDILERIKTRTPRSGSFSQAPTSSTRSLRSFPGPRVTFEEVPMSSLSSEVTMDTVD